VYTVHDDKITVYEYGNFVGNPQSTPIGIVDQVLLQNRNLMIFGGRDGVRHFNEVWECRGSLSGADWVWERTVPGLDVLSAEDAECAAATKIYPVDTYDSQAPTQRPRPGGPLGFEYYDGDPDTDPLEILWRREPDEVDGMPTLPNWDHTLVFGGWDESHSYDGGNIHDWVENYNGLYGIYTPLMYKSTDCPTTTIAYAWGYASDAFSWENQPAGTTATNCDLYENIQIGATLDEVIYTGINMEEVLNTAAELGDLRAYLRVRIYNSGSDFQVRVVGELDDITMETVANQNEHVTLTSPDTYYMYVGGIIDDPTKPQNKPSDRETGGLSDWAFNTDESIVTISNTGSGFQWYDIDVTTQVIQMLQAAIPSGAAWEFGNNMGFLIIGMTNSTGTGYVDEASEELWIRMTGQHWAESNWEFSVHANWYVGDNSVRHPHERKSTAMAFSSNLNEFVLFGGIDGVRALDDTWTTIDGFSGWNILYPETRPPARWGHCMVECPGGVIVFGGFDSRNRPLNDLWQFTGTDWVELLPPDGEVPPPRGGAAMCPVGEWIAMFGGTDGEVYFNDTWILTLPGMVQEPRGLMGNWTKGETEVVKWFNIQPCGEQSRGPSPRAFMLHNNSHNAGFEKDTDFTPVMFVFGGRSGTLPTGTDTDGDWVRDGIEIELGGPDAGRDPRVNALIAESLALNTNETIPYAFKRLGGISFWWPFLGVRSAIMDFESLAGYYVMMDTNVVFWSNAGQSYAARPELNLPAEGHSREITGEEVIPTGYDAYASGFENLWWHRFGGGDPLDPRDEWEIGEPHAEGLSSNAAPPVAHSGRWCYGTDLNGYYPDSAVMELYTPLFDLTLPAPDSTSAGDPEPNTNGFWLVFHEWLDLADANDMVRIDAVRPSTGADIATRVSGVNPPRPVVNILPNRNNAYNTAGSWRRVVVPLEPVVNEQNLYFRFVLQSDTNGHSGGWYVDDVAILQAGQISGFYTNLGTIYLFGTAGTNALESAETGSGGDFGFEFLAAGQYRIVTGDGSGGTNVTISGNMTWDVVVSDLDVNEIVMGIVINSPVLLSWTAVPGMVYEIQYSTPEAIISADPWTAVDTVIATSDVAEYIDWNSENVRSRLYRVVLKEISN